MILLEESIEHLTIFALVWSFCCTTNSDGRIRFNTLVKKLIKDNVPHIKLPEEGNIYSYRFNLEEKEYLPWEELNSNFSIDSKAQYH